MLLAFTRFERKRTTYPAKVHFTVLVTPRFTTTLRSVTKGGLTAADPGVVVEGCVVTTTPTP